MNFLKNYLYNMQFYDKFDLKYKVKLTIPNVDTIQELNNHFFNNNLIVVIHSLMTFNNEDEMFKYFDKLNDYFILLHLVNLKDSITRSPYKGKLKSSNAKFADMLKQFIGDRYTDEEFKKLSFEIERTKPLHALKYEKIKKQKYIRMDRRK